MLNSIPKSLLLTAATAAVVLAQGHGFRPGGGNGPPGHPSGPAAVPDRPNLAGVTIISGAVAKVNLAYGLQNPSVHPT